jgi:hypothetical protein
MAALHLIGLTTEVSSSYVCLYNQNNLVKVDLFPKLFLKLTICCKTNAVTVCWGVFYEILNLEGHPNWFKSYCTFAEWVDFAYWWNCIGKGLHLQPAQQACSKMGSAFMAKKCRKQPGAADI